MSIDSPPRDDTAAWDRGSSTPDIMASESAPPKRVPLRRLLRSRATGWLLVAVLVLVWQLTSIGSYNPTISSPSRIAQEWWKQVNTGTLLQELLLTLRTMLLGFIIAVPVGIALGFVMGRVRFVWGLLEPLVELSRLTPVTAILPIFVLFLGLGDPMKIGVFLVTAVFPVLINSYAGAKSVSKILGETALTFRLSWWETQWQIAFPAALPFVLVGLRQAIGTLLVLAVVVGMLAGNDGIGYYLILQQQTFNIPALLAGVLTTTLLGYGFNAAFVLLERRLTRWRVTDK